MFGVRNSSITTEGYAQVKQLSGLTQMLNWKDLRLLPKGMTKGQPRRAESSGDM